MICDISLIHLRLQIARYIKKSIHQMPEYPSISNIILRGYVSIVDVSMLHRPVRCSRCVFTGLHC